MIRGERGLTLPEVLIATAIIGVGLLALMAVVPAASYGIQEGNQLSTATFLAQQRLEQVRSAAWSTSPATDCVGLSASAAAAPTPSGATCNGSTAATFADEAAGSVAGFPAYARTVRIESCGAGAGCAGVVDAAMRLVRVNVSYRPMTGTGVASADKTVTLEWLLAQR
jgi:prepilin-type N-terminal cleavage/methylation domain-containing protein